MTFFKLRRYFLLALLVMVLSSISIGQGNGDLTRVIIQLNTEFTPEGQLSSPSSQQAQRSSIATTRTAVLASLRSTPGAIAQTTAVFETIPFVGLILNEAAREALSHNPNVVNIQDSTWSYATTTSSLNVINAVDTWNAGIDGYGQVIAILDTGIDFTHPTLIGKNVDEACFSYTGAGTESLCPNGNNTQYGSGASAITECLWDLCYHGTHVAATAAGNNEGEDANYFGGVAPEADIIGVQVFSYSPNDLNVVSWSEDQLLALEWIYDTARHDHDIVAVNMSLGGDNYTSICDTQFAAMKAAIDTLRSVDIAVIVASGNESYINGISAPACISSAISVGATLDNDTVASFSNSASFLDLLAPGVSITAPIPDGSYDTWQGTSMATPHVTGAWALMAEAYPEASVSEILSILESAGTLVTDGRNGITKPRIDVFAALPDNFPPERDIDMIISEQEIFAALNEMESSTSIDIILVELTNDSMKIYAGIDGEDGIVNVILASQADIIRIYFKSVTNISNDAPSSNYLSTINNELPSLIVSTFDDVFDKEFSMPHDITYIQMVDGHLNVWNNIP